MTKLKKTASALIIAALLLSCPRALAVTDANILAESALLVEPESGTVLYEKNKSARRSPDGLAKIMTVLLIAEACERGELDTRELLEMTDNALRDIPDGGSDAVKLEEKMSILDLMYCAYLGSMNEACNLLAIRARGTITDFVAAMNARAAELGCEDTRFTNTHGLADAAQCTTAWDLYLIYNAAMKNKTFAAISSAARYKTEPTNISAERTLSSPNYLLSETSRYYYQYCTGGRPSATYENGYNLVASAEREGMRLISVVLGAKAVTLDDESTQMQNLSESKRLFEWGFSSFAWREILSVKDLAASAAVKYGDGADYVILRPETSIIMLVPLDVPTSAFVPDTPVIYSQRDGVELVAPVNAGDVLGELTILWDGKPCGTVRLVANTSIALKQTEYIKARIKEALGSRTAVLIMIGVALLFGGYLTLVIRYNLKRRERMRKIREARLKIVEDRRRQVEEEEIFRD